MPKFHKCYKPKHSQGCTPDENPHCRLPPHHLHVPWRSRLPITRTMYIRQIRCLELSLSDAGGWTHHLLGENLLGG